MSTKVRFGNKIVQLPGAYSRIVSAQNNTPLDLDWGKLLIIDSLNLRDSLKGNGMLGGAGVNGELASGKNAIYRFKNIRDFRDFVGPGWWYKAAEGLFNPDGRGNGVSEILVIKPATTKCAKMRFSPVGSGSNGGVFEIKTRDESSIANGATDEVRATSTVTVTSAGTTGNTISIKVLGVIVASYTNLSSDSIPTVVAGLASNMTTRGICEVVTSVSPALVFKAPVGSGVITSSPAITVTGTATATSVAFAGGVTSTKLTQGYAFTLETGTINSSKWILKIWKSTYKGLYSDNIEYDEILVTAALPSLVAQSTEFDNISTLITWATRDSEFGKYFELSSVSTPTGDGSVISADILNVPSYSSACGGSATYDSMDDVLDTIQDLDYNYILTTYSNDTDNPTLDINLLKIKDHISSDAKFSKYLMVYGADSGVDSSITYAQVFNSERVNLVHGYAKKSSSRSATGFREWNAFFHACYYVGRILGLAPEVPLTYKSLNIEGVEELKEKDQVKADTYGVLATIWDSDFGKFINLHDINTLQNADYVLNNDATSHLIQIERIKSQLDKELIVNSKLSLLSDPAGVNRTSLTEEDAVEWTKAYLQRKVGSLIVDYRNVSATTNEDTIFVYYEASPNTEIKGIFFTGGLYI